MTHLPLDADEIHLLWPIKEGGIGVTACTDAAGNPYLGLYPLTWSGAQAGRPSRFSRSRLMADIVAGFIGRKPIVVFVDAEVTTRGLSLTVCPPSFIALRGYERHQFTSWNSEAARYALTVHPVNSNWPFAALSKETIA